MNFPTEVDGLNTLFGLMEDEGFQTPDSLRQSISIANAMPTRAKAIEAQEDVLRSALEDGDVQAAVDASLSLGVYELGAMNNARDRALNMVYQIASQAYPAEEAFAHLAPRFNDGAAELVAALELVDPDADPDDLGTQELVPWQSIPGIVRRLDFLSGLMALLYRLGTGEDITKTPGAMTALCVLDPGSLEGAEAAVATWSRPAPGRAGVWGVMVSAGYQLEATADIADLRWESKPRLGTTVGMNAVVEAEGSAEVIRNAGYSS